MWLPAALRPLGVADGAGSLHPRGLLLRTVVRALRRNVPSTVTAGDSPLPSPGTTGHRYRASSNTSPFDPMRFFLFSVNGLVIDSAHGYCDRSFLFLEFCIISVGHPTL